MTTHLIVTFPGASMSHAFRIQKLLGGNQNADIYVVGEITVRNKREDTKIDDGTSVSFNLNNLRKYLNNLNNPIVIPCLILLLSIPGVTTVINSYITQLAYKVSSGQLPFHSKLLQLLLGTNWRSLVNIELERIIFENLIKMKNYQEVIFCEDNILLSTERFLEVCERIGIATVVVPYSIGLNADIDAFLPKSSPSRRRASRMIFNTLNKLEIEFLSRLPIEIQVYRKIYDISLLGIDSYYSGRANTYLFDSRYDFIEFEKQYNKHGNCHLINPVEIYLALNNGVIFDDNKQKIIVLLPPSQYYNKKTHFKFETYVALLNFIKDEILEPLSLQNEILVFPHPREEPSQFKFLESDKVRVSSDDVSQHLYPNMCGLIAFGSSGIKWGLSLEIPTLNIDLYGYPYHDVFDIRDQYYKYLLDLNDIESSLSWLVKKIGTRRLPNKNFTEFIDYLHKIS